MPVDLSGAKKLVICRDQASAADTVAPTGDSGTLQSASTAVEIPAEARGGVTHALVYIAGSAASPSTVITILGLPENSSEEPNDTGNLFAGKWFALWQLNGGTAISATTKNAVAPASNVVLYAEALSHITAYRKLTATVTSFTNISTISVAFLFEEP